MCSLFELIKSSKIIFKCNSNLTRIKKMSVFFFRKTSSAPPFESYRTHFKIILDESEFENETTNYENNDSFDLIPGDRVLLSNLFSLHITISMTNLFI